MLPLPMQPSRTESTCHFPAVQRLCQHIVGSHVKSFCPQMIVRNPRSHNEEGRDRKQPDFVQQLCPRSPKASQAGGVTAAHTARLPFTLVGLHFRLRPSFPFLQ